METDREVHDMETECATDMVACLVSVHLLWTTQTRGLHARLSSHEGSGSPLRWAAQDSDVSCYELYCYCKMIIVLQLYLYWVLIFTWLPGKGVSSSKWYLQFWAITLSPWHFVVNWPVFTIYICCFVAKIWFQAIVFLQSGSLHEADMSLITARRMQAGVPSKRLNTLVELFVSAEANLCFILHGVVRKFSYLKEKGTFLWNFVPLFCFFSPWHGRRSQMLST